jgi:hypothetical protein
LIDWGQVWNYFRSGIGIGALVAIGLIVLFIIYYLAIGSRKSEQIKVAKWRARKLIETGEIPDDKTYNYIYDMLSQVPYDIEAIELLKELDKFKNNEKTEKST